MSQELAIHQVNSLYEDCAKGLWMERKYIRTRSNGKNVGDWLLRRLNKVTDEFHNWKPIRRNVPKRHRAQMDRFFALWDGYFQQGIESVHSATGPKSETGLTIFPIATHVRLVRCVFSSERPDRPRNRPQKATVPVVLGKRRRREVSSFREIAHRTEVQNRTYHFPSYDSYLVSSDVSARVGIFSSLPLITLLAFFRGLLHDEKEKKNYLTLAAFSLPRSLLARRSALVGNLLEKRTKHQMTISFITIT